MEKGTSAVAATLRAAGALLAGYARDAETCEREDIADDAAEIRRHYARVRAADPDNTTAAVGLAVLSAATLRAKVNELGEEWWEDDDPAPFAELEPDERSGRSLARRAVAAARHALDLDPTNNLVWFVLGQALEWLGEHAGASTAYREALRLDPFDDPARHRLAALDEPTPPPPRPTAAHRHTCGFYLVHLTQVVDHSGTERGEAWLLTDPAEVRAAVDGWLPNLDSTAFLDETFQVETYVPGQPIQVTALREALRTTPNGQPAVHWPAAVFPSTVGEPLPAGQPVRELGRTYFFGRNEHTG